MTKHMLGGLVALLLLGWGSPTFAHEAGDWLVRFGVTNVDPKSNNHPDVSVDDAWSATFNAAYMFTGNWALEILAAYPFKHDISLVGGPEVAEAKHLPPTLSVQYHFLPTAKFQPYVGLGVNYTTFFSEKTRDALQGVDLSLDDSWGLAGQLGADIPLNDRWFLNVDMRYIDIETDAKLDGADAGTVKIDPWVYGLNLGFKF